MASLNRVKGALQNGLGIVLGDSTRANHEIIRSEDDFPDPEIRTIDGSDKTVIPLEENVQYEINGTVNHSTPLLSQGGEIKANNYGDDLLNYTGSDTQIYSRDDDFFMSDLILMAASGTVFDVSGNQNQEHLLRSVAVVMADDVGTFDGMRVPTFEFCSFDFVGNGITFEGTPNKIFVIGCPIRNVGDNGIGIEFGSTLTTEFIDVSKGFFKDFGSSTTGVRLDPSATLTGFGVFDGNLIDDSVDTQTDGFDQTTPGWRFNDNNGIPDSKSQAGLFMNENATATTIPSSNTYVVLEGTTTEDFTERFNVTDDFTIEYTGERDVTLRVVTAIAATAGAGNSYEFAYFKNGSVISNSEKPIDFGLFLNNNANFTMNTYVTFSNGDTLDVRVQNTTNADDVTVQSIQLTAGD